MFPADMNIDLAPRETITDNLVFIDGLMRTGKHLAAGIAATFERCEMWQNLVLAESAPIYHALGKISEDAAIQMIQTEIDTHFYYSLIGRRVNFRYDDASSVWNSRNPAQYLQRISSPSEQTVLEGLPETRPISLVFTHEVMCHPGVVFLAYPNIKFILNRRNPVEIVDSWIRKKWGSRIGSDPTATAPALDANGGAVPWFAFDWQDEYLKMAPVDRIINSVNWLNARERDAIAQLTEAQSKQILPVHLEMFSADPDKQIKGMADFLGTELLSYPDTLRKFDIPKLNFAAQYDRKLAAIKDTARPESYDLLLEMADAYSRDFESVHGLELSKTFV